MNLGYACINMTLSKQKEKITTNRGMVKKTFLSKGVDYASELALQNAKDMIHILKWNNDNNIKFFRMSSEIFPWSSEYDITKTKHYKAIERELQKVGDYAKTNGIRLTCHPGPFNVLVSPNENVVKNTLIDLENHGRIFDIMGLERSPYNKINIHCNGVYGDKVSAMDRFCKNFELLSESVKSRLTIENDDKESMYSVKDLVYIHEKIGIPIVFDYLHYQFCKGDISEEESLRLAVSTWQDGITPIVHYSESKQLHENNSKIKPQAHSDYIDKLPNTYGYDVDIMLECKMKELALLKVRNKYLNKTV